METIGREEGGREKEGPRGEMKTSVVRRVGVEEQKRDRRPRRNITAVVCRVGV